MKSELGEDAQVFVYVKQHLEVLWKLSAELYVDVETFKIAHTIKRELISYKTNLGEKWRATCHGKG